MLVLMALRCELCAQDFKRFLLNSKSVGLFGQLKYSLIFA